MRFAPLALMWLALCATAHAESPPKLLHYPASIPGVEKLADLSCRVNTFRSEVLAVSLLRGDFKPEGWSEANHLDGTQLMPGGFRPVKLSRLRHESGSFLFRTWLRKTGYRVDVIHRPDGSVCIWKDHGIPKLGLTANAAAVSTQ